MLLFSLLFWIAVSPNLNINRENRSHSKDGSGGLSESVDTGYGTQTGSTTLIPTTPVITKTISSTIHTLPTSSNVDNSKQSEQEVEQEIIQPVTVTTGRIYSGSLPYVGKSITDVPEDKYDVLKGVENILVDSQHSSTIEDDKINSTSTGRELLLFITEYLYLLVIEFSASFLFFICKL